MSTSRLPRLQASVLETDNLADEVGYKDVFFPDLGSEQEVSLLATTGFEQAQTS